MALSKIVFKPGLNRDQTTTSGEGGWFACDRIRFRSGFPEKIGGWVNAYPDATPAGICRQLFNYVTSTSDNLVLIGTNKQVYVEFGNQLYNVTPVRTLFIPPDSNNCFTTGAAGSTTVTVTLAGHGAINGDYVTFVGIFNPLDGIPANDFNTEFEVSNVTEDTFTITVATPCTNGGVTGGGNTILAAFDIHAGPAITTLLIGWGAGGWGEGSWGKASGSADAVLLQRDWWFDNYNDNVVMNYRKGPIYYWDHTLGYENNRAQSLIEVGATYAPPTVMQTMVDQAHSFVLAFGCNLITPNPDPELPPTTGAYDPLLIRWCNFDDILNWLPTDENTSGQYRLASGSQIVRAFQTRQEILIWTENSLNALQYNSTSTVYDGKTLATGTSIMGCRAVATANDTIYWMGKDKFYTYSGRVETIPCTLRNHIFNNINLEQFDQVVAGANEGWNEIWWFYPTKDSLINDAYVVYNYIEKIWYYGTLSRTAWMDSPLRPFPMAADPANQKIYYHENGCDADGTAFSAFITSNDVDLDDGQKLVLTKRIIPDLSFAGSTAANPSVYMTLKPRNFPGNAYSPEPEETVQRTQTVPVDTFTEQIFIRARARQMAFSIMSDGLGVQWQLGAPRLDSKPDGRR
jgi:hypothetical protein